LTVALGDLAGSWGVPGMKRVLMMSIEEVVVRVLASERSYSTPQGLSIHVRDVTEDRRLIHPSITLRRDAESQPLRLTAREGRIQLNPQTQQLDIIVDDFHIEGGSFRMNHPKRGKIPINLDKVFRKGGGQLRPSELPLLSLRFQRQQTQTQLASMRGHQATHAAFSLASARWDKLSNEEGQRLRSEIKSAEHRIGRLDLEPWRRWATGFSCLCFCFVGAPLAVLLRSRDYWMTFGACFLPILLIYYPLMMLGTDQAKQGEMPLYAPWLGNITLLAIGVFLVTRVRRY
ncbi:MAG: LptF/LptG family permease, partial [Planctomycetota bacterium]